MKITDRRKKLLALSLVRQGDRLHRRPGLRAELWAVAVELDIVAELLALGRAWVMHAAQARPAGASELDAWLAEELLAALPLTDVSNAEIRERADKRDYDAVVEYERREACKVAEPKANGRARRKGKELEPGVEEVA